MQGRGLKLAALFLLVILGGTFTALFRQRKAELLERERSSRDLTFEDAAAALGQRAHQAEDAVRRLADSAPLRRLARAELDADARQEAFGQLDRILSRRSQDRGIRALRVLAQGQPVAGYSSRAEWAPPLDPPPPPPILEAAAEASGRVVFDLPGDGRLRAATHTSGGMALVVEVDAGDELARCEEAATGGAWALLAGEQVVHSSGGAAPPAPEGRSRTALAGDQVTGAIPVPHSPWTYRVRVPVAEDLGGNNLTLVIAALSALLVVWLGARGAQAVARQESLEESSRQERQLQAIFDAITDSLVVVDAGLRVIRANRVAREELGKDLVGREYEPGVCAPRLEDTSAELAGMRQVFSSGEPRQVELTSSRGRVLQVAQYPIFAPDLKVIGVVEHARDITQTRMLQSQLVQSEKLSTLGEMAAGIAHEINNPIGVVSMFAQLLSEELRETQGEDASALEKVAMIEEQATNVGEIVKGLLRFARKSEGSKTRISARAAIDRALTIVRHQKILKGIELVQELPDEPLELMGDEGQLSQVVLNLVVNASHAMEGEGKLTLSARRRGPDDPPPPGAPFGQTDGSPDRIDVAIADSGKGIQAEELERIFEPFFTTKPAGKGTGLGLSVGFGIIRDHGGCIWVHSAMGEGTVFTLDLPACV